MATTLYLKMFSTDYYKSFPQATSYICAVTGNSDGFKLVYRILELFHPQRQKSKGDIHKSIAIP